MPQITLRLFHDKDIDQIRTWRNSSVVSNWMYGEHVISETEHHAWFHNLKTDGTKKYWLIESDGRAIGVSYIYDIDSKNRHASWGFYIVDDRSRRTGAGYYVEVFMLYFVFEHLKLNKLNCEVLAENNAVWKLHEKLGFRREGLFLSHISKAGKYHDVIRLALLQSKWLSVKQKHLDRLLARGQQLPDFSQLEK